jgi:hypothetical protein
MLWLIVLILVVVLLVGSAPVWPYSAGWGYSPAAVLAIVALVLIVLWLTGIIQFTGGSSAGVSLPGTPTS